MADTAAGQERQRSDQGGSSSPFSTATLAVFIVLFAAAVATYIVGYVNGKGVATTTTVTVSDTGEPAPAPSPAFDAAELAAPPTDAWLTNGGSLSNQRYSPLDQIDTTNVAQLKGEWLTHLAGSGVATKYSGEATPLVRDGVIYTVTGADDVFATSVATGDTLWRYRANLQDKISTVCCGWTNRGVAMGDGRIYLGQLDGKLVALDQTNGEVVWATNVGHWRKGETITNAPLYYDGRVYTGLSGGEFGIRGRLTAYDAQTGKLDWRSWTVPGPGQEGHDTWPAGSDSWKHGGAPVWNTPAVDPELGLMYFSTGNASPDLNGSGRAGDNLFTTAIVAVDAATGEYRWHFQEVHHDIWDYDAPSPVVLWDADVDGQTVHGLSEPGKTGWLYMLDRETGKPIHGITEKPVPQMDAAQATADTQPFPDTPPFSIHDVTPKQTASIQKLAASALGKDVEVKPGHVFDPFAAQTKVLAPGPTGGTNWPPSSFSPQTEMVYVCGVDGYAGYQSTNLEQLEVGTTYLSSVLTFQGFGSYDGSVTAVDVSSGDIAWQEKWPGESCYSGTTATAGGLVFVGRSTGQLVAYDAGSGKQLWSFQTGAGANATPAIFEQDGTEYVVFYAAGNSLAGSPHGDNLWLFSLDGEKGPVKAGSATQAAEHAGGAGQVEQSQSQGPKPGGTDARLAKLGQQIFGDNCSSCHGFDGTGGNGGPDLTAVPGAQDINQVLDQVANGGGGMPAFQGQLTPEEIKAVAAYVVNEVNGGK